MNSSLIQLELGVLVLALGILLLDFWVAAEDRRKLGYVAATGVALILIFSFLKPPFFLTFHHQDITYHLPELAFGQSYVLDDLAMFFKRFFLLAATIVLLMSAEFSGRFETG